VNGRGGLPFTPKSPDRLFYKGEIMKNGIFALLIALAFCVPSFGQEPIPETGNRPKVEILKGEYFAGATEEDKAFIDAARKAVDKSDISRLKKFRIKRRLNKPRFVEFAKSEIKADLYWDDPEAFENGAIDWENVDWEKLLNLILSIIQIFA